MNAEADQVSLPHGAYVMLRQSGGLRFSIREVTVCEDGRVIVRWQGKLDSGEGTRRITPAEVAELKELIAASQLLALPRSIGSRSPDGYAYEVIVRAGRQSRSIEFFDGSIPAEVQPLLKQLKALAAIDDAQE